MSATGLCVARDPRHNQPRRAFSIPGRGAGAPEDASLKSKPSAEGNSALGDFVVTRAECRRASMPDVLEVLMSYCRGHVVHFARSGIVHIVAQSRHGGGHRSAVAALQRLQQSRDVVGNRAALIAVAVPASATSTSGARTSS